MSCTRKWGEKCEKEVAGSGGYGWEGRKEASGGPVHPIPSAVYFEVSLQSTIPLKRIPGGCEPPPKQTGRLEGGGCEVLSIPSRRQDLLEEAETARVVDSSIVPFYSIYTQELFHSPSPEEVAQSGSARLFEEGE